MRIVVTGAAGFVGSSITDRLLEEGHTVVGIDCLTDYYGRRIKDENIAKVLTNDRFLFHRADLATDDLAPLLDGADVVFHQAAQAGVRASWGSLFDSYTRHNILATQRLLDTIRSKQLAGKVVYASSSSIYGNAESFPTREDALPQPVSPYGVTKLAAEHLMVLYAKEFKVPTVSLRYFTVFGPRQRPDMAFHKFIRASLKGDAIPLYGDGEQSRDFTFISDAVEANLLAARYGQPGEVFNIGGGSQATVNQIIATLEEFLGPIKIERMERQPGDARHTGADTSRARDRLKFKPKVTLNEGLRREVEWFRENQELLLA